MVSWRPTRWTDLQRHALELIRAQAAINGYLYIYLVEQVLDDGQHPQSARDHSGAGHQ